MKIDISIIDKALYVYLFLPLLIFLIFWLKLPVALVAAVFAIYIFYILFKDIKSSEFEINKSILIIAFTSIIFWCFLSGIGCLHYQSPDWHMRNAIFHDLINFSNPVYYDNGSSLVYYLGYFLPSTLVGKIFTFIGASKDTAFQIANIFCLLYSIIGIFLMFLEICYITKAKNYDGILVLLIFIFFSGLDVLIPGADFSYYHIEWHYPLLQYSSNTTQLFWVYNQAIASWAITLLFLRKPYNIVNFGVFATLSMFFAPLPFIGLSVYLLYCTLIKFISYLKHKNLIKFFKQVFSIQNLISVFVIMPIVYFYYKSNTTAVNADFIFRPLYSQIGSEWYSFFIFEVGLYLIYIYQSFYKSPIYHITFLSLIFLSFYRIGSEYDFAMRTSIPALLILMVYVIKFLFSNKQKLVIVILLIFGSITPLTEIYRGFFLYTKESPVKDNIKTLNNKINGECGMRPLNTGEYNMMNWGNYCNYGTLNPDNTTFFKYLAKKKK